MRNRHCLRVSSCLKGSRGLSVCPVCRDSDLDGPTNSLPFLQDPGAIVPAFAMARPDMSEAGLFAPVADHSPCAGQENTFFLLLRRPCVQVDYWHMFILLHTAVRHTLVGRSTVRFTARCRCER